jgi:hypothetical protein
MSSLELFEMELEAALRLSNDEYQALVMSMDVDELPQRATSAAEIVRAIPPRPDAVPAVSDERAEMDEQAEMDLALQLSLDAAPAVSDEQAEMDLALQLSLDADRALRLSRRCTIELEVTTDNVKYVIGRGGSTRKAIEAQAGGSTRITILNTAHEGTDGPSSVVKIEGDSEEAVERASALIVEQLWRSCPPTSKRTILVPSSIFGKVVGPKFASVLRIVHAISPNIHFKALEGRDGVTPLEIAGSSPSELDAAQVLLVEHISTFAQPSTARIAEPFSPASPRHIFIDISNIMISGQQLDDGTFDRRMRLNVGKFCALLEARELRLPVRTRHVVGSKPSGSSRLWDAFKVEGYSVRVIARDERGETGVDDTLHAQILDAIVSTPEGSLETPTLVLVTGDGNANKGYSSFVKCARAALTRGWRLELWAWNKSLSNTLRRLHLEYPDRVAICLLDEHRESITFRAKAETWARHTTAGPTHADRAAFAGRVCDVADLAHPASSPSAAAISAQPGSAGDDCVVCLEHTAIIVIQPCCHLVLCELCEPSVADCPICRGSKQSVLRIFKP